MTNNKIKTKPINNSLKYGVLNARSINIKTEAVVDFILEHKLDVLCVTPNGFSIFSNPRLDRHGGEVAAIIKNDLCCKGLANVCFSSFETLLVKITLSTKSLTIVTIYRSPGPLNNFLIDLSDFLSTLVVEYEDFLVAGDFNIHMDKMNDESTEKMASLLQNFGLKQHVDFPTHSGGHIIDLVISKDNTQLVQSVSD